MRFAGGGEAHDGDRYSREWSFARDVADRAIFMDRGKSLSRGRQETLFAKPSASLAPPVP
ncbi:hypothetical protein KCP75_05380 [Salmonella enterica subsp. enterica]|nr:hypothetical protein KCP75_05380 [Salmonella enterica subsp. enterica]